MFPGLSVELTALKHKKADASVRLFLAPSGTAATGRSRLLPNPKGSMSVKALSQCVTEHYPYARPAETLLPCCIPAAFSASPLEKDQEFLLYA
jgi:hypothetical protein